MSDFIELTRFLDRTSAELAQSKLLSEGVQSTVHADDVAGLRPFLNYGYGVRLSVHQNDYQKSRELLQLPEEEAALTKPKPSRPQNPSEYLKKAFTSLVVASVFLPILGNLLSFYYLYKSTQCSEPISAKERSKFIWIFVFNAAFVILIIYFFWFISR